MNYQQHFSDKSANYLQFRPDYPSNLYKYLITLIPNHQLAWDCGTGNGQAASELANYFDQVIATDISEAQLAVAIQKPNIFYQVCPAEKTDIANESVDLITVAQALHWFDLPKFYKEVKRVLKPQGVLAAWCYSLGNISPEVNEVVKVLYEKMLGDHYWPPERRYIDKAYTDILFPFQKIPTPPFSIKKELTLPEFIGYLNTWSAVKEFQKQTKQNPVALIFNELQIAWGDAKKAHEVTWPIHLLAGKKG